MPRLSIPACELPPECDTLRLEVRDFLEREIAHLTPRQRAVSWSGYDPEFSRKLGARGWIGMTWPREYGGHARSFLERYVVLEELLAAGAPCAAHWTSDRQSGPVLLRYGTERMRRELIPQMVRGECFFCIGMSEPDAGSDLSSVRSKAERVSDGWLVNGRKIWTSKAQYAHYMIALFRTGRSEADRHYGLTQFLVPLATPGISIRPIRNQAGEAMFNEVLFEDVLLPADSIIGNVGEGWKQTSTELAYERSGPERYLSSIILVQEMLKVADPSNPVQAIALGRISAEARTLRRLSLGVAGMLSRGDTPGVIAAVVKELGTSFEQRIPAIAAEMLDFEPGDETNLAQVAAYVTQIAPSFSLRGGTREILRGVIARGLGLR